LKFEWSEEKNSLNIQKHNISFEEAKEVFLDPLHISKLDHRFDYFEERWITLGVTSKEKILVPSFCYICYSKIFLFKKVIIKFFYFINSFHLHSNFILIH
jgi:uncharacterized DUF497 family protein